MGKKKISRILEVETDNCPEGIDLHQTILLLQDTTKANDPIVQYSLGARLMKPTNTVTANNVKEAQIWFTRAANQGYAPAHLSLGILYIGAYPEYHLGAIEKNEPLALMHFKFAAEEDLPEAHYHLALLLLNDKKDPNNLKLAVEKLTKAASQSHKGAQCFLAQMYMKGNSALPQDKEHGIELLQLLAQDDYTEALYHLGVAYEIGNGVEINTVLAVELLAKAAAKGYKDALLRLATKYELGDGVTQSSAGALKLLNQAAQRGYKEAQFRLAIKYEEGDGVNKDDNFALELLTKAADKGCKKALFYLAIKYEEGRGVEKEDNIALELLAKAANKGYKEAQFYLGLKYQEGRGIEKNELKALDWLTRAAEGMHINAKEYLRTLVEKSSCLKDTYPNVQQLIRACQKVLGERYDIKKMFNDFLPEGIPELGEGSFYYYTYEIYPSEESIPSAKQPEKVYLYIKNDRLNYFILAPCSSDSDEKVYSGNLDIPPGFCLDYLKENIQAQLLRNGLIEPSYEVRNHMESQYKEIFQYEKKLKNFLEKTIEMWESPQLSEYMEENKSFDLLKDNLISTTKKLLRNQKILCERLENRFQNSSQMIDTLKEAYGTTINLEDFYNMGYCMKQLDMLPEEEKLLINLMFQQYGVPRDCSTYTTAASFQAVFSGQYTSRRRILFQSLTNCFRKKHPKFYELQPIFIMVEKMALASNIPYGSFQPAMIPSIQLWLEQENNVFKTLCFELVKPICHLLILDIQQTPTSVIYRTLLEIYKPILLKVISNLQEQIEQMLHGEMREISCLLTEGILPTIAERVSPGIEKEQMPDAKTESVIEVDALLPVLAKENGLADKNLYIKADEIIKEIHGNIKDTSNLSNIIGFLVKVIQEIEPLALSLNASKVSPIPSRCISDDSSDHTQSLRSLPGTSEDLSDTVSSPRSKCNSVKICDELKKVKRMSSMKIGRLSLRVSGKNEDALESAAENKRELKSRTLLSPTTRTLLSPTIGNGKKELISSKSDTMFDALSDQANHCNRGAEYPANTLPLSPIREGAWSPRDMDAQLSPKVAYSENEKNTKLSQSGNSSFDITLRSSLVKGEKHHSPMRNRGTFHFSEPMGANRDSFSNSNDQIKPKKGKSLREKLPFFSNDNTSGLRSSLNSHRQSKLDK